MGGARMKQILDIGLIMDEKEIRLRCGLRFNLVFTNDSALTKSLIDETVFPDGKDVGADVRIVSIRINKYSRH